MNMGGRCSATKEVAGAQRRCYLMVNHGGMHMAEWRNDVTRVLRGEAVMDRSGAT